MSLAQDKKEIFTEIETNRVISEITTNQERTIKGISKIINSFNSVNDNNIIDFLLDLLKSLDGFEKVEEIFDKITLELSSIENEIKESLILTIKDNFLCNLTGNGLPLFMTQGWRFKVSSLDLTELLKIDPNTPLGEFNYDDNFNKFLYTDVLSVPNTTATWRNFLEITYLPNTDEMEFKVINTQTIDEFYNKYLDSINIFPKENIYSKFMDSIFGAIKKDLNFSSNKVSYDELINSIIIKMMNTENLIDVDDSFFEFSEEETVFNETKTNQILSGFANQVFCSVEELSLPLSSITQSFLQIKNSPKYNEIKNQIILNIDEVITNNSISDVNKKTSKNWFIAEFLKGLPQTLTTFLFTPKINFMFITGAKITNNFNDYTLIDFIKDNKKLIFQLTKSILKVIIKYIYPKILKLIKKLVAKVSARKVKEKIRNQKAVFDSLKKLTQITDSVADITEGVSDLTSSVNIPFGRCKDNPNEFCYDVEGIAGLVKNILKKLKLPETPAPPVPTPLILVGAANKPGLSSTKIASRIIERQKEAGIPVGVLPDGSVSPDEIMEIIRIEEITRSILEDMKITVVIQPGIQSFGTGTSPAGPVTVNVTSLNLGQGYAIVQ